MKRLTQITLIATVVLGARTLRAEDALKLDTTNAKLSYAIGMNIGHTLKAQGVEIDPTVLSAGLKATYSGNNPALSDEEARNVVVAYQKEMRAKHEAMRAKQMEEMKAAAATNRAAGEAFLAENAKKEGVKTTADGLQYKILVEGHGEIPKRDYKVKANYRGTLIDGTEFDSSAKHGSGPSEFPVTGVIKGWTEALLKMPVGSKWRLFIPADLAYGDQQRGQLIKPGSTLIFDLELVSAEGPKPIVSDIIKVPSAEEMKKGAKIETLKAEDVERIKAEEAQKQKDK